MSLQTLFDLCHAAAARAAELILFLACYLWLARQGFVLEFWETIALAFVFAAADLALNAVVTHLRKD